MHCPLLDHLIADNVRESTLSKACHRFCELHIFSLFSVCSLVRVWIFVWSTHMALVTMVKVDITTLTPPLILWNIRGTSYLQSTSTALTGLKKLTRLAEIESQMFWCFWISVSHQSNISYTFNLCTVICVYFLALKKNYDSSQ